MKRNANVRLLVLKSSSQTEFLLLRRLCQRFSLSLQKRRSKSLLSLFFLSWEWKFFTKNKTSQYFDNFVKILLIYVKIRRFALFNLSMILAISFVEKYDLANTVTIIANRLSVSMFVSFRLSVKSKKRNFAFAFVKFSILKSFDVVFSSTFSDVVFFSILLSALFVSFDRFFASSLSDYRDSLLCSSISFSFEKFLKKILRFISFFN